MLALQGRELGMFYVSSGVFVQTQLYSAQMGAKSDIGLQEFLNRYRAAREIHAERKTSEINSAISRIRLEFEAAKQQRAEQSRLLAPAFNIFTVLQISRRESSHSNFLAELLDPKGKHGQGTLFLESFVRLCISSGRKTGFNAGEMEAWAEKVTVSREATIFNGRCDLLIHAPNQLCLLIENKIDAKEEETQLARYKAWLDTLSELPEKRLLVFLTPLGQSARSLPEGEYIRLSYARDLRDWLTDCLVTIQAPQVRSVIENYAQLLGTWRTKDVETGF
jgi:hypothetical protein